jgi:DNA-binding NarL/FixJ family response regulator
MSSTKSILVIDGNEKDRQYYAQWLRFLCSNCLILEAANGRTGLALSQSQAIDCVVLELGLPDMSGFEVLGRLVPVDRDPEVPVIVLTGFSNQPLLEVTARNGAYATLQKTLTDGDDLVRIVLKALSNGPCVTMQDLTAISPSHSVASINRA